VMAIVDVLDFMPHDHARRHELIAILHRTIVALACVQDAKSGVWYQLLDQGNRLGNYLESSASCMFVYAIAKGVRNKYLPQDLLAVAQRGYDGIIKQFVDVDLEGQTHLRGTCKSAGLGGNPYRDGSYDYYVSEPIVTDNHHGVGAFLLASNEIEKV
jgi:unsaturated rhamnogalacturonyl hydrolase